MPAGFACGLRAARRKFGIASNSSTLTHCQSDDQQLQTRWVHSLKLTMGRRRYRRVRTEAHHIALAKEKIHEIHEMRKNDIDDDLEEEDWLDRWV